MKLGCASWGFREMNLTKYFDAAASFEKMGTVPLGAVPNFFIEVECFNEEEAPGHIPTGFSPEEMVELQKRAEKKGLRIVSFAGGNDFTVKDRFLIKNDIIRIKKMIDLAKAGGVEIIRLFAGWISEDKITDSTYEQVINGFKEVGKYAQNNGIILAMENHGGITRAPEQVKKILNGVNLTSVGLTYDPANFHHCRINPLEALKVLKGYIVYVHLKDSLFKEKTHSYEAIGEGEINWQPILDWLKEDFEGYAMIEYERTIDIIEGTRKSLDYLR